MHPAIKTVFMRYILVICIHMYKSQRPCQPPSCNVSHSPCRVKTVVWVVVIVHLLVASYFLLVAVVSTGRTREELTAVSSRVNLMGRCAQAGVSRNNL